MHAQVRERIVKSNDQAMKQANKHKREAHFQPGDLVWIHLRKKRFPNKRKSKLMLRSDGPFEVLEKIRPNAYKIDLPSDYGVSATFNVADFSPYYDEHEELSSLRSNSNLAGKNDRDHQAKASNATEEDKEGQRSSKEVKEINAMVRDALTHNHILLSSSTKNRPGLCTFCSKNTSAIHMGTFTLVKPKRSAFK